MKFTISKIEKLVSAKGTPFARSILKSSEGKEYQNVTLFGTQSGKEVGMELEGELERNDYNGKEGWKFQEARPASFPPKANNIAKAMDTKNENIKQAQERKQASMEELAAFRDATMLTVAYLGNRKDVMSMDEIQSTWKSWRSWLKDRLNEPF